MARGQIGLRNSAKSANYRTVPSIYESFEASATPPRSGRFRFLKGNPAAARRRGAGYSR
jgi:hypothetical protein